MARVGRRGSFVRGPRRLTDWAFGVQATGYTTVAAGSKVLLASIASTALLPIAPATVIRTRGYISVASDQSAGIEDVIGAFGMAFVNETARALGVTAIPGPASESLFDGWFVHQLFEFKHISNTSSPQSMGFEIDSKAMRKFDSDLGLVFMVENNSASNG